MTEPLTDAERQKLAAALEQLESERRRREDEKIAAGTAVRLPLRVILHPGEDKDSALRAAMALSALRAGDDTLEVFWEEPVYIQTGVPRAGLTPPDWRPEPNEADCAYRPPAPPPIDTAPEPLPAPVREPAPAPEWKSFATTVAPPSERDMGVIIEARYHTANGELRLDLHGKLYAEALGPNDDPLVVARRLLRQKYGRHEEFYGRINYPSRGIH